MLRFWLRGLLTGMKPCRRRSTSSRRFVPELHSLGERIVPAVTVFVSSPGNLMVFGDSADNTITVSRTPKGTIQVNGTAIPFGGGVLTVAQTALITVAAGPGNDTVTLNTTNGSLPKATLLGGKGNDTLTGGSSSDQLTGGVGNDTITGGAGNDTVSLGDGDDTFIWNPGDASDVVEGGTGSDTMQFNGSAGSEIFTASTNGDRFKFTRNVGNIVMDTNDVEILNLNALGGADVVRPTI
jgi:Ca2+-binding RTX toxin-like protein